MSDNWKIATRRDLSGRYNVPESTVRGWIEKREHNNFPQPININPGRGIPEQYWIHECDEWVKAAIKVGKLRKDNGPRAEASLAD